MILESWYHYRIVTKSHLVTLKKEKMGCTKEDKSEWKVRKFKRYIGILVHSVCHCSLGVGYFDCEAKASPKNSSIHPKRSTELWVHLHWRWVRGPKIVTVSPSSSSRLCQPLHLHLNDVSRHSKSFSHLYHVREVRHALLQLFYRMS